MDKTIVTAKPESLRRCLARLQERCPKDVETLLRDLDRQDIVSLNLTRAVQLCVDIAMHWLQDFPAIAQPQTMAGGFEALAALDVLEPAFAPVVIRELH